MLADITLQEIITMQVFGISHMSHQAISLSHTQPNNVACGQYRITVIISTLSTLCAISRRLRQYERP